MSKKDLSAHELAAQVVFPRLEPPRYSSEPEYRERIVALVKSGVGGFCIFKGGLVETPRMIGELQRIADKPLLFCADFEHGLAMRLENGTAFPHALASGMNPNSSVGEIAAAIARESRSIGVYWNLAPVCDVNSNKFNPVINIRSYGADVEIVNARSAEYIRGTQSERVAACAKHFPGHGDTEVDSHLALPKLAHTGRRLREFEMKPFENSIRAGVDSIMVAHLSVPALSPDNLPATLSRNVVTSVLREELSYNGVIVTDALDMKAITDNFSDEEAVLMAARAGNDVLLLPPDPERAIETLAEAVDSNSEFRRQIEESALRIEILKRRVGLFDDKFEYMFNSDVFEKHERLALNEAYDALKIIGDSKLLPLSSEKPFAGFAFVQGEDLNPGAMFFKYLAQAVEVECDFGFIDENITDEQIVEMKSSIFFAESLIFAFFLKKNVRSDDREFAAKVNSIMAKFADNRPVVAVVFGNPNPAEAIRANAFVLTFSDSLPSIAAAIVKISGRELD